MSWQWGTQRSPSHLPSWLSAPSRMNLLISADSLAFSSTSVSISFMRLPISSEIRAAVSRSTLGMQQPSTQQEGSGQRQDKLSPGAGDNAQGWRESSQRSPHPELLGMTYPSPSPKGLWGAKFCPPTASSSPNTKNPPWWQLHGHGHWLKTHGGRGVHPIGPPVA